MNVKKLGLQLGLFALAGAFFFISLIFPAPTWAKGKAVIVLMDKLSLNDLASTNLPAFNKIINQGSLALMNTNSAAFRKSIYSYSTIGAGNRAMTGEWGGLALNGTEKYLGNKGTDLFAGLTGYQAKAENIVHLGLPQMDKICAALNQTVVPGGLGQALANLKIKRAVIGNADTKTALTVDDYRRYAVTIAMDKRGVVDMGNISSSLLLANNNSPFILSTNYEKLLKEYKHYLDKVDFLVIETGDMLRLDEYDEYLLPSKVQLEKTAILKRIDAFLNNLLPTLNPDKDLLLLVAPTPSKSELFAGNGLTPLIAWGKDIKPGFLTSGTTHRKGIVTNLDIAPTVINFFNGTVPFYMSGQKIESIRGKDSLSNLIGLNRQIVSTSNQHGPVLKTFVTLQIISVIIILLIIFISPSIKQLYLNLSQNILLGLAFVPWILLVFPLWKTFSLFWSYVIIISIAAGIVLALKKVSRVILDPFVVLGLTTSLSILLDLFLGAPMMKASLLGYDPMVGARFYGIGNEYSGVLLGSTILGGTALIQRFPQKEKILKALTFIFFLLVIYVSASPHYGTDVGGTITSIVAFTIVYLQMQKHKIRPKTLFKIGGVLIFLLVCLILWDYSLGSNTHIGRAAVLIKQEGWQGAKEIIQRKLATNWRLIRYTIWTRVLLTFLAALAILFFRPIGVVNRIVEKYPHLAIGFIGIIIASIVGMAVNDSGVVQAATTIIYGATPLVYLVLEERRKRDESDTVSGRRENQRRCPGRERDYSGN